MTMTFYSLSFLNEYSIQMNVLISGVYIPCFHFMYSLCITGGMQSTEWLCEGYET